MFLADDPGLDYFQNEFMVSRKPAKIGGGMSVAAAALQREIFRLADPLMVPKRLSWVCAVEGGAFRWV